MDKKPGILTALTDAEQGELLRALTILEGKVSRLRARLHVLLTEGPLPTLNGDTDALCKATCDALDSEDTRSEASSVIRCVSRASYCSCSFFSKYASRS